MASRRALSALSIVALLLSSCGPQTATPVKPTTVSPTPLACRIGPDDGPPLADLGATGDRGIGGTGITTAQDAPKDRGIGGTGISTAQTGDRGIGGTGIQTAQDTARDRGIGGTGIQTAQDTARDRGIGGTGIVGVVTGFASVCVNGLEVAYAPTDKVMIDGVAATPTQLRAGQVVAIEAVTGPDQYQARRLSVDHAVIGRIDRVAPGRLVIAGQTVAVEPSTRGAATARVGDWVAVSGFLSPAPDDPVALRATRIDPARPGKVQVTGTPRRGADGTIRIAALTLVDLPAGTPFDAAQIASGDLVGDRLLVDAVRPTAGLALGPAVSNLSVGGIVVARGAALQVGQDFTIAADAATLARFREPTVAVVDADVGLNGRLQARGVRSGGPGANPGAAPASAPAAAPVPERDQLAPRNVETETPAAPGQAPQGQPGPAQAAPGQAAPGQAAPGQAAPGQAAPGQAAPMNSRPSNAGPGGPGGPGRGGGGGGGGGGGR